MNDPASTPARNPDFSAADAATCVTIQDLRAQFADIIRQLDSKSLPGTTDGSSGAPLGRN